MAPARPWSPPSFLLLRPWREGLGSPHGAQGQRLPPVTLTAKFLSPAKFLPHYSMTVKCSLGLPQCGDIFLWFHGPFPESVPMAPKDTPTQLRLLNSFPTGEPPGSSPYNFCRERQEGLLLVE